MNIKEYTGLIIQKDNEYLVGVVYGTTELRWSWSPWDAWITRRRDHAERVADRVGGVPVLFNPVAGQLKGQG